MQTQVTQGEAFNKRNKKHCQSSNIQNKRKKIQDEKITREKHKEIKKKDQQGGRERQDYRQGARVDGMQVKTIRINGTWEVKQKKKQHGNIF